MGLIDWIGLGMAGTGLVQGELDVRNSGGQNRQCKGVQNVQGMKRKGGGTAASILLAHEPRTPAGTCMGYMQPCSVHATMQPECNFATSRQPGYFLKATLQSKFQVAMIHNVSVCMQVGEYVET